MVLLVLSQSQTAAILANWTFRKQVSSSKFLGHAVRVRCVFMFVCVYVCAPHFTPLIVCVCVCAYFARVCMRLCVLNVVCCMFVLSVHMYLNL